MNAPRPAPVEFTMQGLRLYTENNANEDKWTRAGRAKKQRRATFAACKVNVHTWLPTLPARITITRVAPVKLRDDDNERSCAKHVRDEVAAYLGIDDGDKRITWNVEQERRDAGVYATRVRIEPLGNDGYVPKYKHAKYVPNGRDFGVRFPDGRVVWYDDAEGSWLVAQTNGAETVEVVTSTGASFVVRVPKPRKAPAARSGKGGRGKGNLPISALPEHLQAGARAELRRKVGR